MGTRGEDLHDNPESVGINYPDFNTYSRLLTSGHINDTVSNAAQAAADGVPYPYAGFTGPAYAAIAPIPRQPPITTPWCLRLIGRLARARTTLSWPR